MLILALLISLALAVKKFPVDTDNIKVQALEISKGKLPELIKDIKAMARRARDLDDKYEDTITLERAPERRVALETWNTKTVKKFRANHDKLLLTSLICQYLYDNAGCDLPSGVWKTTYDERGMKYREQYETEARQIIASEVSKVKASRKASNDL
jgi:hypothetical protein